MKLEFEEKEIESKLSWVIRIDPLKPVNVGQMKLVEEMIDMLDLWKQMPDNPEEAEKIIKHYSFKRSRINP